MSPAGPRPAGTDPVSRPAPVEVATEESLTRAAEIITKGGLVVTPSRTNYGLVCSPFDGQAIRRVFEVKRRTKFGPLTVFIARPGEAEAYVRLPSGMDTGALHRIWPGELALIFERAYPFPEALTLGSPTVAVCCQGESPLQRLAQLAGSPLAGTSANLSGQGDIFVDFAKALADLGDRVDLVLRALGEPTHPVPPAHPGNTIVDLTFDVPRLVRHGAVPVDRVRRFFPDLDEDVERYRVLLDQRLGHGTGQGRARP